MQYYAVGLFDLLGQGTDLVQLERSWENEASRGNNQDVHEQLRKTVGAIDFFRKAFNRVFEGYEEQENRIQQSDINGADDRAGIMKEMRGYSIHFQGFSDTVIVFLPLGGLSPLARVNGVATLIQASAGACIFSLAAGLVPRGAVEVGLVRNAG